MPKNRDFPGVKDAVVAVKLARNLQGKRQDEFAFSSLKILKASFPFVSSVHIFSKF